jgi:glycine cleavage system H protein
VNVPSDLKYTKTHEWVRVEGDTATIGITDYAQSELGDIVYVDLPAPGRSLQADQTFGSVESVKTVSDIYAPVAGEVVEVNDALGAQSELINSDPYGKGWLVKMRFSDGSSVENLLDPDTYRASLDH